MKYLTKTWTGDNRALSASVPASTVKSVRKAAALELNEQQRSDATKLIGDLREIVEKLKVSANGPLSGSEVDALTELEGQLSLIAAGLSQMLESLSESEATNAQ